MGPLKSRVVMESGVVDGLDLNYAKGFEDADLEPTGYRRRLNSNV
jgi:hypothetical protein